MHVITLFMWGYQSHFRISLTSLAKRVFEQIGLPVEPKVFLVGLARPDHSGHPVCIEPEDGEWTTLMFNDLPGSVQHAFDNHEMHRTLYTDAETMAEKPERIRRLAVTEEIRRQLEASDSANGVRSFCSMARPLRGYDVVCVLQLQHRIFSDHPSIRYSPPFRFGKQVDDVETSLIHECVKVILDEAERALRNEDNPGKSLGDDFRSAEEIVLKAAQSFMRTPFTSGMVFSELFGKFNRLSQLMYEGKTSLGSIILADKDDAGIQYLLKFAEPIQLSQTRWGRKVLQLAGSSASLIAGPEAIYGVGSPTNTEKPYYTVDFVDHFHWQLRLGPQILMQSRFGSPSLPNEMISPERFASNLSRIFGDVSADALATFKSALDALLVLPRGSMLVVAEDAAQEARRLSKQGTTINPTPLSRELLEHATKIDGTILVDPSGLCHAVGVILDGAGNDECTPSRGARYNSAVRYVYGSKQSRMALVISEDRTLDIIPLLRKQIDRQIIHDNISALCAATLDTYHRPRNVLDEHRFYLSQEQCELVNRELSRLRGLVLEASNLWWNVPKFASDPEMNDSYFY